MTIAQCIENVTDWLNESVCPKIKLKLPDDNQNGKECTIVSWREDGGMASIYLSHQMAG